MGISDYSLPKVTKASEENDRISNGCKETILVMSF